MIVGSRPGPVDLDQPRPHLVPPAAAQRADLSRHRRQRDSLQRPRQQAGRAVVSRPEQQPVQGGRRRRRDPASMWHSVGGGESGWATPDPVDSKLVWSIASGSGSGRRHRRPLRREPPPVPQRRGVAAPVQWPCRRACVIASSGRAASHLAARSQHHLYRQPARAPDDGRRAELDGDQSRPDAQRQDADGQLRRAHRRQHRRRVCGRRVRDRRVAQGARD